jgi:excisionase family DNA binding protein
VQTYLTPQEAAQQLKVETQAITELIREGKLRAIRIGEDIRIPAKEFERLTFTCPAGPVADVDSRVPMALQSLDTSRQCLTRNGTPFRVSGSVASGAEIWVGKMRYPIKLPKSFMDTLLVHFPEAEVPVGGSFDGPTPSSLGEFVQQELKTKMNPAVYVAALLIDEGYAEASRRGYIRFRSRE